MRHILSVLLENEPGALARVVGLFAQRGYNINSLNVTATEDATLSRLTLVTRGDDQVIEQMTKQLHKLIEVVKLTDLSESSHIERELMMVKVKTTAQLRDEVKRCADIFRAQIIDVTANTYTIEVVGTCDKLEAFIQALNGNQILETVRSGASGIARGEKTLSV